MKKFFLRLFGATLLAVTAFIFHSGSPSAAATSAEDFLEAFVRDEDTPSYLTLYYRRKHLQFAFQPHPTQPVVFFGDSMTDRGDWNALFPSVPLVNLGIGGDTTAGLLNRIDQVVEMSPPKIFLMIGTNDLCFDRDIPATLKNYDRILSILRTKLPQAKIYIESVLPYNDTIFPQAGLRTNENIRRLNENIKKIAEKHGCPYLDITAPFTDARGRLPAELTVDGLHLNEKGYRIWRDAIAAYVKKREAVANAQ